MNRKRSKHCKRISASPPDITAITYAFSDAQALGLVTHKVMVDADYGYGLAEAGMEALQRVSDPLDEAEHQLTRFIKAKDLMRVTS